MSFNENEAAPAEEGQSRTENQRTREKEKQNEKKKENGGKAGEAENGGLKREMLSFPSPFIHHDSCNSKASMRREDRNEIRIWELLQSCANAYKSHIEIPWRRSRLRVKLVIVIRSRARGYEVHTRPRVAEFVNAKISLGQWARAELFQVERCRRDREKKGKKELTSIQQNGKGGKG